MSTDLYKALRWLPRAPSDFRDRCRSLAASDSVDPAALQKLASFALDETQLRHLSAAIAALRNRDRIPATLAPFTLGIIGNATLEPLAPALVATALRYGIALTCVVGDYGQTIQQSSSPESSINQAAPDAVLVALDHRGLPLHRSAFDATVANSTVQDSVAFVDSLRSGFREHGGALCILQTIAPPPETIFGSLDRNVAGTLNNSIARFNDELAGRVADTQDVLFDLAHLAATVGLSNWYPPTQWHIAKLPFDAGFLPLYADHVCRIIAALRGKSRRALVLDLDNTLWGGVIGDDGIEGIVLGQGNATGEAFIETQQLALDLRSRGIVLAVSSKNDDAIARSPFLTHPEMLLREEHIAVFQANWEDKARNIAAIARELALGLDAFVLLDDNPAERALVREALPAVAVPELPADPALYARTLAAAGYFEATVFSEEDRQRASFYRGNALRAALQQQVVDVESYLNSLRMRIVFRPFDETGRSRISQLINKSNQFNLTTRRYSEAAVAAAEADPAVFTLQVRLIDAFGDNGMIGVVVAVPAANAAWEIDTWLMSCRVLGRRVEQMMLREILHHARSAGIKRIVGRFIPTERNAMVAEHYAKLGFRQTGGSRPDETTWELEASAEIEPAPMEVDRTAFDTSLE